MYFLLACPPLSSILAHSTQQMCVCMSSLPMLWLSDERMFIRSKLAKSTNFEQEVVLAQTETFTVWQFWHFLSLLHFPLTWPSKANFLSKVKKYILNICNLVYSESDSLSSRTTLVPGGSIKYDWRRFSPSRSLSHTQNHHCKIHAHTQSPKPLAFTTSREVWEINSTPLLPQKAP